MSTLELPTITRPGDEVALDEFLTSPEVAGVVDRLLAFHVLADEFHHHDGAPPAPLKFRAAPQTSEGTEYRERLQDEVAELRRQQQALNYATSYEAQSDALRRECSRVTELWFESGSLTADFLESVYDALRVVAERAYAPIKELSGKSAAIRLHLRQWLNSVEPRLRLLDSVSSLEPYLAFEDKLRRQAAAYHRWLIAPHLGREVRVSRNDAYVQPRFQSGRGEIPAADVVALIDRTVVLGDPGAGKSSFGGAVCFQVATEYEARVVGRSLLTPMFVTLRHYASGLTTTSLSEHLEAVASTIYQITPPPGAMEYLLTNGRLLVVFDGLDELLDVSSRQRLRDAIEGFCHMYPMTRVLVTARTVGYQHAALGDEFETVVLQEFDDTRVTEYCVGWFGLHTEAPADQQRLLAQSFLRESNEHASDLRRNPLMLALLCGVYRGEGTLPASRPGIYQRCVDLLLRQWDALRQIKVEEPLGEHLERTLREVAHWAYETPEFAQGIPERMLVRKCTALIAAMRTEDTGEASRIARSFIHFCRGRAWVLVEVGHDHDGEALFAFAHRTFMEFFAAQHLEKRSRTPLELADTLRALIGSSSSVIPHLALQLANASRDDAGDEILRHLMNGIGEDEDDPLSVLLFVVDALRFITPRPATTRWIAREIATGLIRPLVEDTTRYDGAVEATPPWPFVAERLASIAVRNIRSTVSGFSEGLTKAHRKEDSRQALDVLWNAVCKEPEFVIRAWRMAYPELAAEE